ncbi:RNA polymerase sigma-70 factor (ECF subfamily) [Solirubrobacter pauli]|uniref:RNA polymerase sigma-70 factor (ECF subfamily) n=1 Tax=Solirubrobacter pauli TaxID=166793 RepID=A0A660KV14_9ACTN|nr:RNA polymerase sigma factor SigJ [Solirubrobacter pauli]RKQ84884.1 RNA polymerase sigma-70 factor (ECF subfamily) [Solirubrobacter pauli]
MSEPLAAEFEQLRPYLRRVAYGVLGSLVDAEDVVQDAWFRLQRVERSEIDDLRAYLAQVVARRALDVLGSARMRRETYVGPWLPEPVVDGLTPEDRLTLDESISLALLVVLEKLSPAERTAFVLHDVFGYSFGEVGRVVGRGEAAVRQLASRARRHVESEGARFDPSPEEHREVFSAFTSALEGGDVRDLVALLDPDVVMVSDGGGIVNASRTPLLGADRVARALIASRDHNPLTLRPVTVNGRAGLIARDARDGTLTVLSISVRDGHITRVHIIRNPEKLGSVEGG